MGKIAPLTKIIFTVLVSVWAVALTSVWALAFLVGVQLVLMILGRVEVKTYKATAFLALFAALLFLLQYVFVQDMQLALVTGLKMMAMAMVFILVLATTRVQDLTAALVSQCRIPYEYAFMFTTALRFVPDFLSESRTIQEAQACRGYSTKGNVVKRLINYLAIVKPLVLRAVSRSETMALSMELRGFGSKRRNSSAQVALGLSDYAALTGMAAVTAGIFL
ncbi:putative membrane protein [Propionispora sp. 2/2-37]|uniref:energy-coupling factor transporter transmembrane component T family protein n=1 Tax=Propionispora sp. 2/2-37 TaxID=1677858 RepID=UPI0006BB7FB0|nr:energy-coupling factor transporter transmembrane component T [Propionispora sp. 2/2-37]CUH97498.1 putative membrane protein [Propionispora sp. 2/2-37]